MTSKRLVAVAFVILCAACSGGGGAGAPLTDGVSEKVHVIRREGLEYLYNFGDGGRTPGQFFGAHSIATDSRGNIFVTETYEVKRVQKFVYRGIGPAPSGSVGVVRPN